MYIPSGWRLPTVEDYQDLIAHIKSLDYDAGTVLKSTNQWHGSAEKGIRFIRFLRLSNNKKFRNRGIADMVLDILGNK